MVAACFFQPFPASGKAGRREGGMVLHPGLEVPGWGFLSMRTSTSVSNVPDEA